MVRFDGRVDNRIEFLNRRLEPISHGDADDYMAKGGGDRWGGE